MKIDKKAFFTGVLSGILAPSVVNANISQTSRKIPSLSSYEQLSDKVKSDKYQMIDDFYASGDDIKTAMWRSNG